MNTGRRENRPRPHRGTRPVLLLNSFLQAPQDGAAWGVRIRLRVPSHPVQAPTLPNPPGGGHNREDKDSADTEQEKYRSQPFFHGFALLPDTVFIKPPAAEKVYPHTCKRVVRANYAAGVLGGAIGGGFAGRFTKPCLPSEQSQPLSGLPKLGQSFIWHTPGVSDTPLQRPSQT